MLLTEKYSHMLPEYTLTRARRDQNGSDYLRFLVKLAKKSLSHVQVRFESQCSLIARAVSRHLLPAPGVCCELMCCLDKQVVF